MPYHPIIYEEMRKLIVSMNVTLNGFMAGPKEELDWHFPWWTEEMSEHARQQLAGMDTIVLGRVTYESMASYWPKAPDNAFARMMNEYTKIVFSRSLLSVDWKNAKLVSKDIGQEISRLKMKPGQDMIIYGSGSIVKSLLQMALIDEFRIWLHPVLLSNGHPLFKGPADQVDLHLIKTKTFSSGVTILYYQPANISCCRVSARKENGFRLF